MEYQEYNNLQKVASDISGYCYLDAQGAQNDCFYERTGKEARREYIIDYCNHTYEFELDYFEVKRVVDFLDDLENGIFEGSNEIDHAFLDLDNNY